MKIHVVLSLIAVVIAAIINLTSLEWVIVVFCMVLIFFAEMMNTTVETIIDLYYMDQHSQIAKDAKDIAAGTVLISAFGVSVVAAIIYLPKIIKYFT